MANEKPNIAVKDVVSLKIWPRVVNEARAIAVRMGSQGLAKTVMAKIIDSTLEDIWELGPDSFAEHINIFTTPSSLEQKYWSTRTSDQSHQKEVKRILVRLHLSPELLANLDHASQEAGLYKQHLAARLIQSFLFGLRKEAFEHNIPFEDLVAQRIASSFEKVVE